MNTTNYILSKTVGGFLQLFLRGFSAAPPPATYIYIERVLFVYYYFNIQFNVGIQRLSCGFTLWTILPIMLGQKELNTVSKILA